MRRVSATVVLLMSLNGCWTATSEDVQDVGDVNAELEFYELPQELPDPEGFAPPDDPFFDTVELATEVEAHVYGPPVELGKSDEDVPSALTDAPIECVEPTSCPQPGETKTARHSRHTRPRARACKAAVHKKNCPTCNPCEWCQVRQRWVGFRVAPNFLGGNGRLTGVVVSDAYETVYSRQTELRRGVDYNLTLRDSVEPPLTITFLVDGSPTPPRALVRAR